MVRTLLVVLSLLLLVTGSVAQPDCDKFQNAKASDCTAEDKRKPSLRDLDTQLEDAQNLEGLAEFLVNITLGIYKYLYPCSDRNEAILVLFYDQTPAGIAGPPVGRRRREHYDSEEGIAGPPVGRRRREHYDSEEELLRSQLNHILQDTGEDGGCLVYLMNKYKGKAAEEFKTKHPNYFVPSTTTTTTTTTTPTTTTTLPTTTTPSTTTTTPTTTTTTPTTTTTTPTTTTTTPTTTTTTPTTTTTTPTTTTTTPTTTIIPATCTGCSMLSCLINPKVITCPPGDAYCLTTVHDDANGRNIERGCTSESRCLSINNDDECQTIETNQLSDGITCEYCCLGDNCNQPPQLLPDPNTLYP